MKANTLNQTIAALLLALPIAHADDQKAEEKKDATKQGKTSSSSSVITSADGTATVTIDINGKKETRTFKLGDGGKMLNFGKDGDGAAAASAVGFAGKNHPMPEHAKREKGPWIGIAMEPVQEVVRAQLSLAPGEGIVVSHVAPESPAAKAGLEANDILLRFEDQILVEPAQLQKLIAMKKPGDGVKLTYLRKGERKEASVTLVEHEIESHENKPAQWFKTAQGGFAFPGAGGDKLQGALQEQFKLLKEKHPGIIVDKKSWLSGTPGDMLKEQIEKLQRSLEDSKLPKEEIEKLRKGLEKARHEAEEAMERAKRGSEEAMEHARRAVEEALKALNDARKPFEKEKKGEQPKKSGEPQ